MPPTTTTTSGRLSRIELLNLPTGRIHHRLLLLIGRLHPSSSSSSSTFSSSSSRSANDAPDGHLIVTVNGNSSPVLAPEQQQWEVNAGWFKALVPLVEGPNSISLRGNGLVQGQAVEEMVIQVEFQSLQKQRNRLHLIVVAAKDSPWWDQVGKDEDGQGEEEGTDYYAGVNGGTPGQTRFQKDDLGERERKGRLRGLFKDGSSSTNGNANGLSSKAHPGPAIVDCPPGWRRERIQNEGGRGITRRLALQAYLWQAFHAEQMRRHGFGHRTFELAEDPTDDPRIQSFSDIAHVRLLKCDYTMAQMREADRAQQHPGAKEGGAMHSIGSKAVEQAGFCKPGDAAAVLIADSTWDSKARLLRAHAAVGAFAGLNGSPSVGVMGSHWLWAAPVHLHEVTASFLDAEPTDEKYCCNDLGEGRTAALTVNIGSGAMLHEAGHAISNPHYPTGFMARGYIEYNRVFMTRETHSVRGGNKSKKPITLDEDSKEFHVHRCQAVRARLHPAFRHPDDPPPVHILSASESPNTSWEEATKLWLDSDPLWKPTRRGAEVVSSAGIALLEIEVNGNFRTHIEYSSPYPGQTLSPPKATLLTPQYLSDLVKFDVLSPSSPEVKITAVGCNLRSTTLDSYRQQALVRPIDPSMLDRQAGPGLTGGDLLNTFGRQVRIGTQTKIDNDPAHQRFAFLFRSAWSRTSSASTLASNPNQVAMRRIDIFLTLPPQRAVQGLGFVYTDHSSQLLGSGHFDSSGQAMPDGTMTLDVQSGETLDHIQVRSGWWIDAVNVVLSSGRQTGFIGGQGGGVRVLDPSEIDVDVGEDAESGGRGGDGRGGGGGGGPEEIVGIVGTTGAWCDSLGILVADRWR